MRRLTPPTADWPQACLRLARRPAQAGGARLWRVVLLALAFAALHSGLVSAWAAWRGQAPWVQICTAEGMRWVATNNTSNPQDSGPEKPAVLQQGCLWAHATLALPAEPPRLNAARAAATCAPPLWVAHESPPPDTPTRVLLMAAMRAPPRA